MSHGISAQRHSVLTCLSYLPQKILSLHGTDNVTEFVLHDLSHQKCFNFKKAAFFIDNPEFNCLKGIAGFSQDEQYKGPEHWDNPTEFSAHMRSSNFNKKVRSFETESLQRLKKPAHALDEQFAEKLTFTNPHFYSFAMKHGNQGLLVFQHNPEQTSDVQDLMPNGACLLGFCPVF